MSHSRFSIQTEFELPNGYNRYLTRPNGLSFCKHLIIEKIYALTGKTPLGALLLLIGGLSLAVQLSPTESNRIQPNSTTPPLYSIEPREPLWC
jgi:hypothetical protein